MLFHSFSSQDERQKFGGGDFLQFVFCQSDRGIAVEEIVSNRAVAPLLWNLSSLYLCGEDWNEFCSAYGEIITGGTYENLETGYLDGCGINYFSPEQMQQIIKRLREEKPKDYHLLLTWMEQGAQYNGFYLLGL